MALARRTLASRGTAWAHWLAKFLVQMGVTPNFVSIMSIVFAGLSIPCFMVARQNPYFYIIALICIQLRLCCNLMDGMLAIEHKLKSVYGDLFNEIPDRVADSLIFYGAGIAAIGAYSANIMWLVILLSIFTAYIRLLGGALKLPQRFLGPMAKQHRMFTLSVGCLLSFFFAAQSEVGNIIYFTLVFIFVGLVVTSIRRILYLASDLRGALR